MLDEHDVERGERIDRLADRMLKTAPLDKPATEVWDEARDIIDARDSERIRRMVEADQRMIADMEKEGLL
jgi:hypothetical protein